MIKYTFAIVPFRFQHELKDEDCAVRNMGFWKEQNTSYTRLYAHVVEFLDRSSPLWGAVEYRFDFNAANKKDNIIISNRCMYEADFKTKGVQHTIQFEVEKIQLFMFETKIGFAVIHLDFGEYIEFDDMCAACGALKILRNPKSESPNFYLHINSVGNKEKSHSVNLREVLSRILPPDCTVSFERATKSDPSAVMLSSFLLKNELTDAEAVGYLQSLKRAQSKEYNNVASTEYLLHPFKNIYWDFSPQGIANINYSEGYSGQDDFLVKYHNHVGKEYLLMTLLLLHQEYTLIDYCQCLSQLDADDTIDKRMETMYGFKMKYVTSTISHLENYRKFFNLFRNTLNIDDLLAEVEMKLQSMYAHISQARMEEQLAIEKENAQRQEEMNALRKKYMDEENERKERISATVSALSVVLALFGVVSVISDGIQAVNTLGVGKSLLATAIILLAVAIVIVATFILFPIVAKKLKAHIDNFDFTKEE